MNHAESLLAYYISVISVVFLPIQGAVVTIALLVVIDLILGVWAAKKEGYTITSRSMRRSVPKLAVYVATVAILYLIDTFLIGDIKILGYDVDPLSRMATALIGAVEGKSLFENMYRITKVDFLKIMITRLQMVHDKLVPANEKDKLETHIGKEKNDQNN